jgi:cysteine desulfurase
LNANGSREIVYLDYQATTPVDPRVLDAMMPYFGHRYANPSSGHILGRRTAGVVHDARRQVRMSIGARYDTEVVFTSGATEANHLAVIGAATAGRESRRAGNHVITSAVEHPSVSGACGLLEAAGYLVTVLPVDAEGRISPADLVSSISPGTVLVSVMFANNEIGTVQPIAEIAAITRRHGIPLHVDAVQAVGATRVDVDELGTDLLTLSSHKLYGPKGIGALYVRRGTQLNPLFPGSQEYGRRGGTVNVPGVVGLAEALRLLDAEREAEARHTTALRDRLASAIIAGVDGAWINGSREHRLPGNLSITIPGIDALHLMEAMPDVAISAGSACTTGRAEPSHVLTAIGLTPAEARATIRLSVGRFSTVDDIDHAAERISETAANLRMPASIARRMSAWHQG